jgi:Cu+-exporting ATPase
MITEFKVGGIHCASCIKIIKMNLEEIKGIISIEGNEKTGLFTIKYNEKLTNAKEIAKKIEQDGYKVLRQENKKV